jgi:hypothetical protein
MPAVVAAPERGARFNRWSLHITEVEEVSMVSHDAPVKTPAPADERRERFEWSGEKSLQSERPIIDGVDARQGVTGHNVRYVLLFGLVAVIIAFAAILAFDFHR